MPAFTIDKTLPENLALLLKDRVLHYADLNLQASKDENGKFQYYTYAQVYENVIAFALALKEMGISKGDNVALISDNRREWLITDFALQALGAPDVPRGTDSLGTEIRFIISFADCKYGVFENAKQLSKVTEKIEETPALKKVILYTPATEEETAVFTSKGLEVFTFDQVQKRGFEILNADKAAGRAQIEADMENVHSADVATMIFTSGTTGTPKGVMLTHENYMTMLSAVHNFVPCKPGDWWMSVLPVWHSFERLIQYVAPLMKCGIAYSKPVGRILLADMEAIRPQWICGVPRLWEALAHGVDKAMVKKGGIALKLYRFFLAVGKHYCNNRDKVLGHVCRIKKRSRFLDFLAGIIPAILLWPLKKLGDVLVFSKLRAKFGGRLAIAVSGGGALQKDVDDFYRSVGLNLLEGYGLTETSPVISFRYFKEPRPGCVGAIFPTFELKVLPEEHGIVTGTEPLPPGKQGLIFVRGKQIMKGYYKRPDLTEKVIDKDGWLNTGDLGLLTWDNEIKITGRAKDTIVLLDGENIEPAVLESELCTSPYIESAMITGQDKKCLGALIVPSKDAVLQYAGIAQADDEQYAQLLESQDILDLISTEINAHISTAKGFRTCERIYKFALLPESFTVGEELSAKQEMMRFKIAEKYADVIESLFE